jgi:hypothetical protein
MKGLTGVSASAPSVGRQPIDFNQNSIQDACQVLVDVMVPESKDRKACFLQTGIPQAVLLAFNVLAAIQFDDQSLLQTEEVDNVASQRGLPPEFYAERLCSNCMP